MLFIIIGLLVLTLLFKLLGKTKEYGCLIKILILLMLWKSGLLMLLIRVLAAILIWITTKIVSYGNHLVDYLSFIFYL